MEDTVTDFNVAISLRLSACKLWMKTGRAASGGY